MNTPPTLTTTDTGCTAAVTRTQRADGWSNAFGERIEPAQGGVIRRMASPDGALNVQAREVSDGRCLAVLTGARTAGRRRRSWSGAFVAPVPNAASEPASASTPPRRLPPQRPWPTDPAPETEIRP